jgi:hypothetical protein
VNPGVREGYAVDISYNTSLVYLWISTRVKNILSVVVVVLCIGKPINLKNYGCTFYYHQTL